MTQPPIVINFMIACYVSPDPQTNLGSQTWNSEVGLKTREWLLLNGLVGEDGRATDRGIAWVEQICSTPLPSA